MRLGEILSGVETAVKTQWPGTPVYHDYKPKDFKRPSFLLEGGPITSKELGGLQRQVTAKVRLTCFTPTDHYGHSKTEELLETAETLMELFEGGYIAIGDRCPHVTEATSDYGFDYADVVASLLLFEQTDPFRSSGGAKDLMEDFHTKLHEKEDIQ